MASSADRMAAGAGFGALAKADELKKRLWFTVGALIIYRLGTYLPLPGIDPGALADIFSQQSSGILGMFDMFSGGALSRMTIFALNIMPYITASIIMQLMTAIVPSLEALKKDGESGRKMINQYTRYLTVLLATVQGYGIAVGLESASGVVDDPGLFFPCDNCCHACWRNVVLDVAWRTNHQPRRWQWYFADHFCRHCCQSANRACRYA